MNNLLGNFSKGEKRIILRVGSILALLVAATLHSWAARSAISTLTSFSMSEGIYSFDVYARSTGTTAIRVGTSSFYLNYNNFGLVTPTLSNVNPRYTGPSDHSANYDPMTIQIVGGRIAITIWYTGNAGGSTTLSAATPNGERLCTVNLRVINASVGCGLSWDSVNSAISDITAAVQSTFFGSDNRILNRVPNHLAFLSQPLGAIIGVVFTPSVTVQLKDSLGNAALQAGDTVTISLINSLGQLSGTLLRRTDSNGVATFNDLSVDAIGVKRLRATSRMLRHATSDSFTISFGPPGWWVQTSGTSSELVSVKAVSPSVAWTSGKTGTVLRTTDAGVTWQTVGAIPMPTVNCIEALDSATAFVGAKSSSATAIYRTTNGGAIWEQRYQDVSAGASVKAIRMIDANNGVACGNPVGGKWVVLKTFNAGGTWSRILSEPSASVGDSMHSNGAAVVGDSSMWIGTNLSSVLLSTNGGATWTFGVTPFTNVVSVWFNDRRNGVAGGSGNETNVLAVTSDGGLNWSSVSMPGTGGIYGLGGSGNEYWVTRGADVYRLTNRVVAPWWVGVIGPLNHLNVYKTGTNMFGWVVGSTGGIARSYLSTTGVREERNNSPSSFLLEQNYPNPFNPKTTINYQLPTNNHVTLKVYNMLGQLVTTLVDEVEDAGYKSAVLNADNLSSGVYLYRLETGGFSNVKKLVIIK